MIQKMEKNPIIIRDIINGKKLKQDVTPETIGVQSRLITVPILIDDENFNDYNAFCKWCDYAIKEGANLNITNAIYRNSGIPKTLTVDDLIVHLILDSSKKKIFSDILLKYALDRSEKYTYTAKPKTVIRKRNMPEEFKERCRIRDMINFAKFNQPHILNPIHIIFINPKNKDRMNYYKYVISASGGYSIYIDTTIRGGKPIT